MGMEVRFGGLLSFDVTSRFHSLTLVPGEQTAHRVRKSLEEEELLVR
jgi:hypothetical protein